MTLATAKQTALSLLGETFSTRGGNQFAPRLNRFFDMAQKEAALAVPVERSMTVTVTDGVFPLPEGVFLPLLLCKGERSFPFHVLANTLCAEDGTYTMLYRAYPATITEETPDTYEFEVSPSVQTALCFYVAALCILPEDISQYRKMMSAFDKGLHSGIKARVVTQ